MSFKHYNCPVEATIDIIGGKWKPVILFHMLYETKRFGELRRLLPHITQKMLNQQLRELEQDGIVRRTIYTQVPPKVEYSLTEFGTTLEPVLRVMCSWGMRYTPEIQKMKQSEYALE